MPPYARRDEAPEPADEWCGGEVEPRADTCETGCEWLWSRGSAESRTEHELVDPDARAVLDDYRWTIWPTHGDREHVDAVFRESSPRQRGRQKVGNSRKGNRNPNAKLTETSVRDARRRHAAGTCTIAGLAAEFEVSISAMRAVIRGTAWTDLPEQ